MPKALGHTHATQPHHSYFRLVARTDDTFTMIIDGVQGGGRMMSVRAKRVCHSPLLPSVALSPEPMTLLVSAAGAPVGDLVGEWRLLPVSYTHLTLPTIYSV